MRLVGIAAAFAGILSLGACHTAPSGDAAASGVAIEQTRAAKLDQTASAEKICKKITPTGSIMPKRVCYTQSEWDAFEAETAKSADKFNEYRRSGSTEPGTEGAQFPRPRP
jgi:hypothetical protein